MKEYMMISGAEILDNNYMELTLIPLTNVKKKKPSLMDLAAGGLDIILQEMNSDKQHKTKMFMVHETWAQMKLKIGRHVTVEILSDDTTGGVKDE